MSTGSSRQRETAVTGVLPLLLEREAAFSQFLEPTRAFLAT